MSRESVIYKRMWRNGRRSRLKICRSDTCGFKSRHPQSKKEGSSFEDDPLFYADEVLEPGVQGLAYRLGRFAASRPQDDAHPAIRNIRNYLENPIYKVFGVKRVLLFV